MKNLINRFTSAIMLFLFTTLAHAASVSTDLSGLLNNIQSMKADFTQKVYDNHGKVTQKSSGHMALQRPGKFRWDITKPSPQLIIANDNKLWIYDPDLQQLTIRSLQNASGESPALLLTNDNANLDKTYVVKTIQKNSPQASWFSLTPKQQDNMFISIQMGFVKNQIQEMQLKDNLGHTTVIQFQNIQLNTSLASSLFSFKRPAGVDVIDETRKK